MLSPSLARWSVIALLALHAAAAVAVGFFAVKNPLGNWDMVPYTALVMRDGAVGSQQLSKQAHEAVHQYIGDERFAAMVAGGAGEAGYQATLFRDPEAFAQNLRFYDVKPAYIGMAKLSSLFTGSPAVATVAASAVAFVLALALFPLYFRRRVLAVAGVWVLIVVGTPPLAIVAAAASPDTLSLLFVTTCAMAAVARRHPAWIAVAGLLAVLSRPDAAFILCPLLLGFAWVDRESDRWKALLAGMVAHFALFVVMGTQALPWSTLFHHTFFERLAYPVTGSVPAVTVARYLGVMSVTLQGALEPRVIAFLFAGIALAAWPWLKARRVTDVQVLAASAVAGMVFHFIVFPIDEFGHERMFLGSYFVVLAAALLAIDSALRAKPAG